MNNTTANNTERASTTIARIEAWLERNQCYVQTSWVWNGQSRDGVWEVIRDGKVIAEQQWYRNTMVWLPQSGSISTTRTGTRKHSALQELVKKLGA